MKTKFQKVYKRRIKLVLKSELNARNKIVAINILAAPVVTYSYRVQTKQEEIQGLDKMTKKQLCMNRMYAMKGDIERIYLPYEESGKGLMNLEKEKKTLMVGISKHMIHNDDTQIKDVLKHQKSKVLHSVPKEAENEI